MSTFQRYTHLVTSGNKALLAGGLEVVGSSATGPLYPNISHGDIFAYDPTTNETLGPGDVASAVKVSFAQGFSPSGRGRAQELRHLAQQDIDLCRVALKIQASSPKCAIPQIVDFDFGCTTTGKNYMLQLEVDDYMTRGFFKEGASEKTLINLSSTVSGCETCNEEDNCGRLSCDIERAVNGMDLKDFSQFNPLNAPMGTYLPFTAARKFVSSYTTTIVAGTPDVCDGVCVGKALQTIVFGEDEDEITVDLSGWADSRVPARFSYEDLAEIASAITVALNGKGSAIPKRTDCCTYQLEINTCLGVPVLSYHDDATAIWVTTPAFTANSNATPCDGCDPAADTTASCGVRFIVYPLDLPCNCAYPASVTPSYYGRSLTVTPVGDGWDDATTIVKEVQAQALPENLGYHIQEAQFFQSNGGQGFDYPYGTDNDSGKFGLPLPWTAVSQAVTADCKKGYCVWSIVAGTETARGWGMRQRYDQQNLSTVSVPSGDGVTIASLEAFLTALAAAGNCTVADISCDDN